MPLTAPAWIARARREGPAVVRGALALAAGLWHFVRRADVRAEWVARLLHARAIHQDSTFTMPDRYPRLFAAARDAIGADAPHTILSFGCSYGDEVVALRRYFPAARLVGAEINRAALAACRRLPADANRVFTVSSHPRIAAFGPYDAIFCMAVLQRRPTNVARDGVCDLSRPYPFAHFAAELDFLVRQLRPGGLLVVEHAQYRVEDTPAMALLEPWPGHPPSPSKWPRFAPSGARIDPPPAIARLFRRR